MIDPSVAGTTGGGKADLYSPQQRCRDCMAAVRDNNFGVFFYPQTWAEWRRHRSPYTKDWLQRMHSRRRVRVVENPPESALSLRVRNLVGKPVRAEILTNDICAIMLKDCHLVEAALAADRIVISLDDKARYHFKNVSIVVKEIKSIAWINPNREEEVVQWLQEGAGLDKHRLLGFEEKPP